MGKFAYALTLIALIGVAGKEFIFLIGAVNHLSA